MKIGDKTKPDDRLNERLATSGFRFTTQRRHVYDVLLQERDHPTAEEVFIRAKTKAADISMATVYNCLDALVKCGLVRQVNLDRGATRYCPNMQEHCHFYCGGCERIFDVQISGEAYQPEARFPKGFKVLHYDISVRGFCPECSAKNGVD